LQEDAKQLRVTTHRITLNSARPVTRRVLHEMAQCRARKWKARLLPPLQLKTLPGTVHSYNLLDSPLVKLRDIYRWCLVIVVAQLHPGTQNVHNQSCLKFGSLAELLFQRGTHLPLSPLPHASLLPPEEIRASNSRRVSPVNASSFLLLKLLSTSLL
jgi:hypothetical protein